MRRVAVALLVWCLLGSIEQTSTTAAGTSPIRSFVLTQIIDKPPGSTGQALVETYNRPIRAIFTLWYGDRTHWRVAGHYLEPPRNAFLLRYGLDGILFAPFPGVIVDNGPTSWHYDSRSHATSRRTDKFDLMVRVPQYLIFLWLNAPRAPNLHVLLARIRKCHSANLNGTTRIAGRSVYQIDVGVDRCNLNSAAGALDIGAERLWIDTVSFIPLRFDRYHRVAGHRLLYRMTAVRLRYNVHLPSSLFSFTPSPGATGR